MPKNEVVEKKALPQEKTTDYQGYGGLHIPIAGQIDSFLRAVLHSTENPEQKNLSFVNSHALLEFNQIREGRYTLTLFSDRNNDKAYTDRKSVV